MRTGLIALALVAAPSGAWAQTAPAETPAARPASVSALGLVTLFTDQDRALERARRDLPVVYRASPNLQALEVEYPGITDYFIARMLPDAEQRVVERSRRLRDPMAAWLSATMTESELTQVLAFYRNGAGARILGMVGQMNGAPMLRNLAPKLGQFSGDDLKNGASATIAANDLASQLTPAERVQVTAFAATDAGRKWQSVQPGFFAMMADFANRDAQTSLPVIRAEAAAIIAEYERDHPRKASK